MKRAWIVLIEGLFLLAILSAACSSSADVIPTTGPSPTPIVSSLAYVDIEGAGLTSLRCEECRAVEVTGVTGPDIVETPEGPFRLYGVFVAPEEENCVAESGDRLAELAGDSVRIEAGPLATDSAGTPIRYIFTANGDSIDELLIAEGLARRSSFEGQHNPWLLVTADNARRARSGCIWENFDSMFPGRTPRASGGIN